MDKRLKKLIAGATSVVLVASQTLIGFAYGAAYPQVVQDAFNWAKQNGMTNANSIDEFEPYAQLSRGTAAKLFAIFGKDVLGLQPDVTRSCNFSDIDGKWYAKYAIEACQLGLMKGDNGKFYGDRKLFKSEAVVVLARALAGKTLEWNEAITYAQEKGITHETDVTKLYRPVLKWELVIMEKRVADQKQATQQNQEQNQQEENADIGNLLNNLLNEGQEEQQEKQSNEQTTSEKNQQEQQTEEQGQTEEQSQEEQQAVEGNVLEVALDPESPRDASVPKGARAVVMGIVDLTAGSKDVTVKRIVLKREGLWDNDDFDQVYITDENGIKLSDEKDVLNDDSVTFDRLNIVVKAGETRKIKIVADIDSNAGNSRQDYFIVQNIEADASEVHGLPIQTRTITIANIQVASVTIEKGPLGNKVTLGEKQAKVGSIKIKNNGDTSGTRSDVKVEVRAIILTMWGSADPEDLENVALYDGSKKIADLYNREGDRFAFVFNEPFVINDGSTKTLYVKADIVGGKDGETIKFYIDEDSDVVILDNKLQVGATITNNATSNKVNSVTLEAGDITIADNGPESKEVGAGTDDVDILDLTITTQRNVRIKNTDVVLTVYTDDMGSDVDASNGDIKIKGDWTNVIANGDKLVIKDGNNYQQVTLNAAPAYANWETTLSFAAVAGYTSVDRVYVLADDVNSNTNNDAKASNIKEVIKNLELYDKTNNVSLLGPKDISDAKTTFTTAMYFNAGQSYDVVLRFDPDDNTPNGLRLEAKVDFSNADVKDLDSNSSLTPSKVIKPVSVESNVITVKQETLTVNVASNPTGEEIVKGMKDVKLLWISLRASEAGAVVIKTLKVWIVADDNGNAVYGEATVDPRNVVVNGSVKLVDDQGNVVAGPESIDVDANNIWTVEFDEEITIPASTTKVYYVVADIKDTVSKETKLYTFLARDANDDGDVADAGDANLVANDWVVEDSEWNNADVVYSPTQTAGNNNYIDKDGIEYTIATQGVLTILPQTVVSKDKVVEAGTQGVEVARYVFRASKDDYKIKRLALDFNGDAEIVKAVTIKIGDVQKTEYSIDTNKNRVYFTDINAVIPKNQEVTMNVYVDFNEMDSAGKRTGKYAKFTLTDNSSAGTNTNDFEAVWLGSTETKYINSIDVDDSKTNHKFIVRNTVLTFAKGTVDSDKLNDGTQTVELYKFTVTNSNGGSADIGKITFKITTKDGGGNNDVAIDNLALYDWNNNKLDNVSFNITNIAASAGTTAYIVVTFDSEADGNLAAGESKTFILKGDVTSTNDDSVTVDMLDDDQMGVVNTLQKFNWFVDDNDGEGLAGNGHDVIVAVDEDGNKYLVKDLGANNKVTADEELGIGNFIWTDKASPSHSDTTADWANGYGLNMSVLDQNSFGNQN